MAGKDTFDFYDSHSPEPAVLYRGEVFTYAMIDAKVSLLCEILQERILEHSRIGILVGNTPLFVCALLAVCRLKASSVLLSTHAKQYELASYLRDTGIQTLISDEKSRDLLQGLLPRPLPRHHQSDPVLGDFTIWQVAGPGEDRLATTRGGGWLEQEFILQCTSGVSGRSKIVSRSYGQVINEIIAYADMIGLTQEDICVCPAPLFHAYGLINGFLPSFHKGAPLILMEKFIPHDFVTLVRRHRPTFFVGVPFMYMLLNKTFLSGAVDFSSLRFCFSAGAKLPKDAAADFHQRFGVRVNPLYGSTETGIMAVNLYENGFADPESVGRPLAGRQIKIVDDNHRELPANTEGEIIIKSPGTTPGYLNLPEVNEKVFQEGYFHTGDVGRLDPDNHLYLTGRKSSFINVAGLKVDPAEVEQVLLLNPLVRDCAVVGVEDKHCGEIIRAYVACEEKVSARELARLCHERLAGYKVPREIHVMAELPKSPTGKILRKYLTDGRRDDESNIE